MRLREIKKILEEALPLITVNTNDRGSSPRTYVLLESSRMQKAVDILSRTNLFVEQISILKELSFYNSTSENLIIQDAEFRVLKNEFALLHKLITEIINSLKIVIPNEDSNIVSIKIPNPQSFTDISKTTDSLDKIFSQTIHNEDINGSFKVVNFDTGSYWIDVMFSGGAQVLHLVAAISWGAAVVYKKIQEGRLLNEQVKALKISNEAQIEINKKNKEVENSLAQKEAEFIFNSFYKSHDPEQVGRIKLALNELAELFSKGTEIYPSLDAPKDVKNEFPDIKAIESVESKIKKLPSKK